MDYTEKQLHSELIFDGRVLHLYKDDILLPDGKTGFREYCKHIGAVCVVPITDDGKVICVKQYRYAHRKMVLEIPAGKLDAPDEDPALAATRELREETGATCAKLTYLGPLYTTPALIDEVIHMYMAEGLDTGDMLIKAEMPILPDDNFEAVHDKLAALGADTMKKTIAALRAGTLVRTVQDDTQATYAAKIEKSDCLIDFTKSAAEVHNQIRGLSPIPLSFTHTPDGKLLKVVAAHIGKAEGHADIPGKVISVTDGIEVACGNGSVVFTRVVPEGKGQMGAADFVRGRKINLNDQLS